MDPGGPTIPGCPRSRGRSVAGSRLLGRHARRGVESRQFETCVLQQLEVGVGVDPQHHKHLMRLPGAIGILVERCGARVTGCERIQKRDGHLAPVIEDAAELGSGRRAVLQLQVGLASQIRRPELRRRRMIVSPDRLEQRSRTRRVALREGKERRRSPVPDTPLVNVASGNRRATSPSNESACPSPHNASTRPARSTVGLSLPISSPADTSRRASSHWPTTAWVSASSIVSCAATSGNLASIDSRMPRPN